MCSTSMCACCLEELSNTQTTSTASTASTTSTTSTASTTTSITTTPCNHVFHTSCLVKWVDVYHASASSASSTSNTSSTTSTPCPMCRAPLLWPCVARSQFVKLVVNDVRSAKRIVRFLKKHGPEIGDDMFGSQMDALHLNATNPREAHVNVFEYCFRVLDQSTSVAIPTKLLYDYYIVDEFDVIVGNLEKRLASR